MGTKTVIIANDDIVLDPDSYTKLVDDRELLKAKGIKVGFLGARTNMSSLHMNVRNRLQDDQWNGMKWLSEGGYGAGAVDCSHICISRYRRMAGVPAVELVQRQCCL
jgi:hypothetical protein